MTLPIGLADSEPNDSLMAPETIGEGTVTGTVAYNLFTDNDVDFYRISVPSKKDIEVTATMTSSGDGTITITSYDHDKQELGIFSIWMYLDAPGETDTGSWYNGEGSAQNIYLEVSGDGDYEITIEFTDATSDATTALAGICFLGTAGMICAPLMFIIIIVIVIILLVKRSKKKKAQAQQQYAQPPVQQQYAQPPVQQQPQSPVQQQYAQPPVQQQTQPPTQ